MTDGQQPELACTLALASSLARDGATQPAVERALDELMAELGVPGRAAVSVEAAPSQPAGSVLSLSVDGRPCSYPEELLARVDEYVNGRRLSPEESTAGPLLDRLTERAAADGSEDGTLAAFLGLACVEIVKLQPAVLLGPAQAAAYSAALAAPGGGSGRRREPWPPEPDWLLPVLGGVLDLRISVADQFAVGEVLSSAGGSRQEAGEELVAALRPEAVELQLPTAYLRELTETADAAEQGAFSSARDRVFMDLGIVLPLFRLAPAEHLEPRTFSCKVNHLSTVPVLGLAPGERRPLAGSGPLGPFGYLAAALETAVRAHAPCLIDRRTVQAQLDLLGQAFPALAEVAAALLPIDLLTGALRALARDGVSIRNLRQILERLLDWQHPPVEWAERPADLAAFLRAGLGADVSTR